MKIFKPFNASEDEDDDDAWEAEADTTELWTSSLAAFSLAVTFLSVADFLLETVLLAEDSNKSFLASTLCSEAVKIVT